MDKRNYKKENKQKYKYRWKSNKVSDRSDKRWKHTIYSISVLGDVGLSIGQVKVDEKLNEITAIPELLELLDITNAHITIDAIGTQEKITKKIVKKCGHYVFKVKENQRELQKDIRRYFDTINNLKAHKDIIWKEVSDKKNHGRIELLFKL